MPTSRSQDDYMVISLTFIERFLLRFFLQHFILLFFVVEEAPSYLKARFVSPKIGGSFSIRHHIDGITLMGVALTHFSSSRLPCVMEACAPCPGRREKKGAGQYYSGSRLMSQLWLDRIGRRSRRCRSSPLTFCADAWRPNAAKWILTFQAQATGRSPLCPSQEIE